MIAIAPGTAPRTAGFFVRTAAYLIDAFLLSLVGGAFPYLVIANPSPNGKSAGVVGGSILVSFIYFVLLWSVVGHGRTVGMAVLRLRVIRDDGSNLGVVDAIVRWIGLWLSFVLCFLGVIWVGIDRQHRGWHDMLARSLVVHV